MEDIILHKKRLKRNKINTKMWIAMIVLCMAAGGCMGDLPVKAYHVPEKYQDQMPDNARQLAVVRYKGNSRGRFRFYVKNKKGVWKKKIACPAWLGRNGIGKEEEGDGRTPSGLYSLDQGFGLLADPGTKMPYIKVNSRHYWCTDPESGYYNQLIRRDETGHSCGGEHLIAYRGVYDYAVSVGYNKERTPGKGSAIFLHCSGNRATAGCMAIPKKYMKKTLKKLDPSASPQILIY